MRGAFAVCHSANVCFSKSSAMAIAATRRLGCVGSSTGNAGRASGTRQVVVALVPRVARPPGAADAFAPAYAVAKLGCNLLTMALDRILRAARDVVQHFLAVLHHALAGILRHPLHVFSHGPQRVGFRARRRDEQSRDESK